MKPNSLCSPVTTCIQTAFNLSYEKYEDIYKEWKRASFRSLSLVSAPQIIGSLQELGRFDTVIRAMEDELQLELSQNSQGCDLGFLPFLSENWLSKTYAIGRAIRQRNDCLPDDFKNLLNDFKIIRVTLEKYEIANDRLLKEPLAFQTVPHDKDRRQIFSYDKKDKKRHHIMLTGISHRGSVVWEATEVCDKRDNNSKKEVSPSIFKILERRDLSDRFLKVLQEL